MAAMDGEAAVPRSEARDQEDLARESSLVCRENRKLRDRNAELEAAATASDSTLLELRNELSSRPTVGQLEEAQMAAKTAGESAAVASSSMLAANEARKAVERDLDDARTKHIHELDAALTDAANAETQRKALETELAMLKARTQASDVPSSGGMQQQLEEQLAATAAALTEAQLEANAARSARGRAETMLAALRLELEKANADVASVQADGGDAAALKAALAGLRAQHSDLRKHLAEASRQLNKATVERDEARAVQAKVEEKGAAERRRLRLEVESAQLELRESRQADKEKQKTIEELREAVSNSEVRLNAEVKRARREAAEQRAKAGEASEGWRRESESAAMLRAQREERDAEVSRLQAAVDALMNAQQAKRTPRPPKAEVSGFSQFVSLKREVVALKEKLAHTQITSQHKGGHQQAYPRAGPLTHRIHSLHQPYESADPASVPSAQASGRAPPSSLLSAHDKHAVKERARRPSITDAAMSTADVETPGPGGNECAAPTASNIRSVQTVADVREGERVAAASPSTISDGSA